MKRRKRTNKNVPAKGVLRDHCDKLWSLAVRGDWAHRCAVCGARKCEAHHLIPRQHQATRYALRNGIALCATHHQFDPDVSPHQTATGWTLWLEEHHHKLATWVRKTLENCDHHKFDGITNAWYYMEVIWTLREYVQEEDYVRIIGKKFGAYLENERA